MASSITVPSLAATGLLADQIGAALVDVATKAKADINAILGTSGEESNRLVARFGSTPGGGNINLATNGLTAVDGVTPVAGDVALVKNQSTGSQNGVYTVASGAWTRLKDGSGNDVIATGLEVYVSEGTSNADTTWAITTNAPITVDTTSVAFAQIINATISSSTPQPVGTAAAGSSSQASAADHVHAHGNQAAGGSLHAASTASTPGFNSRRTARGVVAANVASLAAFVGVAGGTAQDGVTYIAGDVVLLVAQTTAAQNGPYVVGTVGGGTAPLTRPADWAAASAIPLGSTYEIGAEGTLYGLSSWKATATGTPVVDTNDPVFYPRKCDATVTLSSGLYDLGATEGLWLLSTTKSQVLATRNTVGGTITTTIMYACPVANRTAGKAGTAAVRVLAEVAAGTVNNVDTSTVDVLVINW